MYRSLGATFVKLGQVLSTRPDLLSPESAAELRELQDELPPFTFQRMKTTIEESLGGPIESLFKRFDTIPIAAASVAQVHRAQLLDGTEVAVKVLRPNIRRVVERDGRIIRVLAQLVELVSPSTRLSQPVAHAEHILRSIVDQTDLGLELKNYQRFHTNFSETDEVLFPEVYPELSSQHVLTMTFCDGSKIDEIDPARYPIVAPIIRETFLKMSFEDGFLHADMHPGNFLITDDDKLALYDVGLVCEITGRTLEHFVDFAKCITIGTADDLVQHIRTYHEYLEDIDWPAVTSEAEAIVSRLRSAPISELEWSEFIADVLTLTRRHRIRPLPELVMVMVGVVTAEGIGKQIDPETNTFDDIAKFIMPILIRRNMLPVGGMPQS
jgi:ubiquinone biosynthesis protein